MGIDRESDIAANLQIGPTSLGMVRVYISTDTVELPLDFEPEEAEEIGFSGVLSGPLVRSSYRAGRLYRQAVAAR